MHLKIPRLYICIWCNDQSTRTHHHQPPKLQPKVAKQKQYFTVLSKPPWVVCHVRKRNEYKLVSFRFVLPFYHFTVLVTVTSLEKKASELRVQIIRHTIRHEGFCLSSYCPRDIVGHKRVVMKRHVLLYNDCLKR